MIDMVRSTKRKSGAGYLSAEQYFNPSNPQPSSTAPALSSASAEGWVRPPLPATSYIGPTIGGSLKGSGYLMPAEYFNPNARQPTGPATPNTPKPSCNMLKQPLVATTVISPNVKAGGRRRTRKHSGGFSPGIMGAFVANSQSTVVPLALYGLYHMFGAKKTGSNNRLNKKTSNNRMNKNNA